jgi:alpha-glucosidase
VPAEANNAPAVIPNIKDPLALDAQNECPGCIASNVQQTSSGFKASFTLAGDACNVYGTDIEALDLTVEYQTSDRLHVPIQPTYLDPANESFYLIPPGVVAQPEVEQSNVVSELEFSWSNKLSFGFEVTRKSTKDVLFSTMGKKIVYENQFIEFKCSLPKDYNLYVLAAKRHPYSSVCSPEQDAEHYH